MRIAIVHDIKAIVDILKKSIAMISGCEVIWTTRDSSEAIQKCANDTPDLILMALIMPGIGGIEATKKIMLNSPCAVLILTANVSDHLSSVFEAMGSGAIDVVNSPVMDGTDTPPGVEDIVKKIETIGKLLGKKIGAARRRKEEHHEDELYNKLKVPPLLVMGASTGGPLALTKILSKFPQKLHFATVIVQHVDERFAEGLAQWLFDRVNIPVEIACEGKTPEPGKILIAGKNKHLVLTPKLTLDYTADAGDKLCCPSVDVFFQSVARYWPDTAIAVLLTGMGSDGALGLKLLHDKGWHTIVEHESSCIVYGMPKAAIALGAASEELVLDEIAPQILHRIEKRRIYG